MQNKILVINVISNIFSFGVNMGINFLLTPYIVSTVGKEAYAFVGLANNFVSYAQIITLALNAMATRFITINLHRNNTSKANKYFTSIVLANILLALLLIIPASLVVLFIDKIINVPYNILQDIKLLWTFIFFNFLISIITSTFGIATFATNRLDLAAFKNILSNVLRACILIIAFICFKPRIWYIGLVTIICTIFMFINDFYYKRKLIPELKIKIGYFRIDIIKQLLSSGIWSVLNKLGQILSDGLDLLITNIFIDVSSMGLLALAKTVPAAIYGLLATVSSVFTPQLTIYYAQKDTDKLILEIKKAMKLSGVFTNIGVAYMIAFGYMFYSVWVPSENIGMIQTLSILTVYGYITTGSTLGLYDVFTITDNLKMNSLVTLIVGILNALIVLILLNTTNIGVLAVAGVSTMTAIIKNVTFVPMYAAKCLSVSKKTFYPTIIRYIFSSMIIIIVCCSIGALFNTYTWGNLILGAVMCGIIGIILNYLLLFNKSEKLNLNQGILALFDRIKANYKKDI